MTRAKTDQRATLPVHGLDGCAAGAQIAQVFTCWMHWAVPEASRKL
jgi:hypothetical protein